MLLSDEIIKVLEYLCQKLGVTIDWTSENVMPMFEQLCKNYIKYEIATSVALLIFGLCLAVIGCLFVKPAKRKWMEFCEDGYEGDMVVSVVCWCIFAVLVIISLAIIPTQVIDLIKCITFPELKIFEYIQSLMNQ